jgi:hypothetical protein
MTSPKRLTPEQARELADEYVHEGVRFVGKYLAAERALDALFDEYAAKPQYAHEPRKVAKKGAKADPRFADAVDDLTIFSRGVQMVASMAEALYAYADHRSMGR